MGSGGFLILIVLLFVVFYVLTIRPQRQRQAEHQAQIEKLDVGDDVMTTGGIYGTIVQAEGDDLVVEIADGVEVHMTRRGIAAVLPPEDEEDEDEDLDEVDEDVIEGDEESVTDSVDEGSPTGDRR